MNIHRHLRLCALALSLCAAAAPARAAMLAWGTAANITGDSNVVTTGQLVGAFNLGTTGLTSTLVNGVTFQPFVVTDGSTTSGNFQLSFPDGPTASNTSFGSTSTPYANLAAATQKLLQAGGFDFVTDGTPQITLTMSGLSIGQRYSFELWTNNAGQFDGGQASTQASTGTTSVTLSDNTSNAQGGIGQFAVGTFTADATTQVVDFISNDRVILNAFQLRTVPEPSTWAFVAAGTLGLGLTLRGRRRPALCA